MFKALAVFIFSFSIVAAAADMHFDVPCSYASQCIEAKADIESRAGQDSEKEDSQQEHHCQLHCAHSIFVFLALPTFDLNPSILGLYIQCDSFHYKNPALDLPKRPPVFA